MWNSSARQIPAPKQMASNTGKPTWCPNARLSAAASTPPIAPREVSVPHLGFLLLQSLTAGNALPTMVLAQTTDRAPKPIRQSRGAQHPCGGTGAVAKARCKQSHLAEYFASYVDCFTDFL
jgi:hypothetical protein